MIRTWRNSPAVSAQMFSRHEIGIEEHEQWFESLAGDHKRRYWMILYDKRPVGVINLANIDAESRCTEFGIYLGEDEARGKGVGTCAQFLLLDYVFNSMDFDRVSCDVLVGNEHALRMYKAVGLRQAGEPRQYVTSRGEYFEVLALTISSEEWGEMRGALLKRLEERAS